MHEWLRTAADSLSRTAAVPRDELELSSAEIATLLDAAGLAAHESGARTNAPLLCYLLGVARARGASSLDELVAAAAAVRPADRH